MVLFTSFAASSVADDVEDDVHDGNFPHVLYGFDSEPTVKVAESKRRIVKEKKSRKRKKGL